MNISLKEKKVVVVGAGKTGISAANFLVNKGAKVILNDKEILDKSKLQLDSKIEVVDGGHNQELFSSADLIVISPGVNKNSLNIENNIKIISDIELFYLFNNTKIISITGTNGKTTTTYLIGEILKNRFKVFVGGNIGVPVFERFKEDVYDYCVLELSSFQLENIDKFYSDIIAILNITPDHLDRYNSYQDYIKAKLNIFKNQSKNQIVILNENCPELRQLNLKGKLHYFNVNKFIKENRIIIEFNNIKLKIDIEKLKVCGKHFFEDIYVSALVGLMCNVDPEFIEKTLYSFKGLEHRLEFVKEKNGIKYYNDSKSTTISSTCKAVESFSSPVILIVGGIHKGESFTVFKNYKNIKKIICFGKAKNLILQQLKDISPIEVNSLDEAILKAEKIASIGDVILFSPGCSSFDMFENYIERGNRFKELVA